MSLNSSKNKIKCFGDTKNVKIYFNDILAEDEKLHDIDVYHGNYLVFMLNLWTFQVVNNHLNVLKNINS